MPFSEPIDVVYTWVDMRWPGYLEEAQRHSTTPRDLNPERYRDTFELLRHSLRSVELYAPWVRHIYLLTRRPQVPAWLAVDHPRIRIVHHDEIMPDDGTLPTFNSNTIETFLHLLPGISERFIHFNDDYLLGAPVESADFFAPDGRIKVFGTLVGEHLRGRIYEKQLIYLGLLEHAPLLIDRREWPAAFAKVPTDLAAVRRSRFRDPANLRPERVYRWHLLAHCRDRAVAEPFWRYLRYAMFIKLTNDLAAQRRKLAELRRRRPKFFCLNDDMGDHPDEAVSALVRDVLAEFYPRPCALERTPLPA